ncbi:hypothetical protein BIW11_04819 [Tropilaelaps mercedesae]|uniref:Uncharacterized protein n=1 Tax=Tropilaelaps mercedesae TaxID=418985 RepID=A0A1V9X1B9_9ACAR|nr:hypothetical protein BIW11_04819 [Tropilaelaps mercedesae]
MTKRKMAEGCCFHCGIVKALRSFLRTKLPRLRTVVRANGNTGARDQEFRGLDHAPLTLSSVKLFQQKELARGMGDPAKNNRTVLYSGIRLPNERNAMRVGQKEAKEAGPTNRERVP